MSFFVDLWAWLTAATPSAGVWWLVAGALLGMGVAIAPQSWRRTRLFATYVHEAGHAVVAIATGRRVTRIRLEADTSGTTEHSGPAGGIGRFLTAFAGYPAPALAAWGIFVAVSGGHARWAIAGGVVVAAGLLLVQHSWRGWLVTLVLAGMMAGVSVLPGEWASVGLVVVAGYLLAASPRTVVDLHRARRRARADGQSAHSDADALAQQTGVPPILWEAVFLAACGFLAYRSVLAILGG